jgi:hypothetical protein
MHGTRTRALAPFLTVALAAAPVAPAQAGGPIRDAIAREAAQVARDSLQEPAPGPAREWARLRDLPSGASIDLTTREWQRAARTFVAADEGGVVLVNLNAPGLPSEVSRRMQDLAERAPHLLINAARGATLVNDRVEIRRDGVFFEGRRVSSLSGVIETRARDEIDEIAVYRRGAGFWGHLGPLGGYFAGALAGGYGASLICQSVRGAQECDTGAFLAGMLTGGVFGASYGFHAGRRVQRDIVYRAS